MHKLDVDWSQASLGCCLPVFTGGHFPSRLSPSTLDPYVRLAESIGDGTGRSSHQLAASHAAGGYFAFSRNFLCFSVLLARWAAIQVELAITGLALARIGRGGVLNHHSGDGEMS